MNNQIKYAHICGEFAPSDFLKKCSELYSNNYGVWADNAEKWNPKWKAGARVCQNADRFALLVHNEDVDVDIYYAYLLDGNGEETYIGYAVSVTTSEKNYGNITWVTQLVVHKDYRNQKVAETLLFNTWKFSDRFAWGIVSANPYAIRALEKATRRRVDPARIKTNKIKLINVGRKYVEYIRENTKLEVDGSKSLINTQFPVSHKDVPNMIANVISDDAPWILGELPEGYEWFAFTFKDQEQIHLNKEEIERMITSADQITQDAYSRMDMSSSNQKWAKHSIEEIDYLLNFISSRDSHCTNNYEQIEYHDRKAIDLGCGNGRHSIELAKRGYQVTAIDYNDQNFEMAIREEGILKNRLNFVCADIRTYESKELVDLVLCLYDVVGTYADQNQNQKIIDKAFSLLKNGGYAVFSVMNYSSTIHNAKYWFKFSEDPDRLLHISASTTMEESGQIFDPEYYIVDTETHIVYRKEQFLSSKTNNRSRSLPTELLVCDRRFEMREIVNMCKLSGFEIVYQMYTCAGWKKNCSAEEGKEILLICKKPE